MRVLDLFSGIGGMSRGLEMAGDFETVAFCEYEDFPRQVLKKHWPDIPCYPDVRELTKEVLDNDGITDIGLICGGVPCQPASQAGKRQGAEDDRWLWPEAIRIVQEFHPRWVILENPDGILTLDEGLEFEGLLSRMETIGYEVRAFYIPACAAGARSLRGRIWIVAHSERDSIQGRQTSATGGQTNSAARNEQLAGLLQPCAWPAVSESRNRGAGNGIPNRIHRNKALGNAVVPQVVEQIGRAIMAAEA